MRRSSPSSSPFSSPARKRQRLSSPTYDDQLDDISPEDLEAFDALDAKLSQSPKKSSQSSSQETKDQRVKAIIEVWSQDSSGKPFDNTRTPLGVSMLSQTPISFARDLADDPDNPFTANFTTAKAASTSFSSASTLKTSGFASVSGLSSHILEDHERSPSPEAPPEQDFDSWFQPTSSIPPVAFQTAKATALSTIITPGSSVGFSTASNKEWIAPSSTALAKARLKMNEIWKEGDPEPFDSLSSAVPIVEGSENLFRSASSVPINSSPRRAALRPLDNSLNTPGTPTPTSFSRPSITSALISTPSPHIASGKARQFKSPLLTPQLPRGHGKQSTGGATFSASPLNPHGRLAGLPTFAPAGSQHPLASIPITASTVIDKASQISTAGPSSFITPARTSGTVQRIGVGPKRNTPAPFVTPFKPGMKPGQPGRLRLEEIMKTPIISTETPEKLHENWLTRERPGDKAKRLERTGVFNLSIPPNRKTLASSGLLPRQYSSEELESLGISIAELASITPNLAMYYHFHTRDRIPPPSRMPTSPFVKLDPSAALDQLLDRGCTLATKPWVENHWCLILWKLAGMVALDPERESNPAEKRWCWDEVMRQLLYRYERELNGGIRPPLRLIATQDAPAAYPMALCISNVTWSEAGLTEDGMPTEPHPELEVTDGWYRLRAQVDAPLARAIRKGIIRIGRKIGVAGARLSSERKDPSEILEAYNSTKLVLSGNSSHLIPWHAKLGFRTGPCISTLHSLTGDGGVIACMDLVVIKTYPVAFFEFIEDENGQKNREGPRNAAEEAQLNEQWKKRREVEASKLRTELEKKQSRYEGYIERLERLERRAGAHFNPGEDDSPPDSIENFYDELEGPADAGRVLAGLSPTEAGWLARYVRHQLEKERERAGEEIESELSSICPPRDIRSFRILIVQDTCTHRRPANRQAQLTVWDALNLTFSEGKEGGAFEVGQRYLVTHLVPTQQSAWMGNEPGSEVYMCTRRDSRWTPISL